MLSEEKKNRSVERARFAQSAVVKHATCKIHLFTNLYTMVAAYHIMRLLYVPAIMKSKTWAEIQGRQYPKTTTRDLLIGWWTTSWLAHKSNTKTQKLLSKRNFLCQNTVPSIVGEKKINLKIVNIKWLIAWPVFFLGGQCFLLLWLIFGAWCACTVY